MVCRSNFMFLAVGTFLNVVTLSVVVQIGPIKSSLTVTVL